MKAIEEIKTNKKTISKISVSSPTSKTVEYSKITLRPLTIKNESMWQAEKYKQNKVFHENIKEEIIEKWFQKNIEDQYEQIRINTVGKTITYFVSKNGKSKRSEEKNSVSENEISYENNRKKEYIINEGDDVPAMIELGIFTADKKIKKDMYDKFKQINRFVETIDDVFKTSNQKEITILDFGCGKSYLTFVLYHYFTVTKNIKAKIIGYDLKEDVVNNCNEIAKKYGYTNLKFVTSDITKNKIEQKNIDMVITLHACDTATDYALDFAIKNKVKSIFSVPCCQHEINQSITKGGDYDILLKHGLINERFSALLTDSIRANILEKNGYKVDIIEFVDFSHSPKNLMIRARKTSEPKTVNFEKVKNLMEKYKFKQKLFDLSISKLNGKI